MHFIYEEGGEIKGATAIGAFVAGADHHAAQTMFGKRIKLKSKDIWHQWATHDLDKTMHNAALIAAEIDMDFLWECAPTNEFTFATVADDYFGQKLVTEHMVAVAMALQNAPIYFRRKGRGQFLRAPEEQLKAALIAVERKRQEVQLQKEWEEDMLQGLLPQVIAANAQQLLWSPDKNSHLYKAVVAVSQEQGISTAQLLLQLGAIRSSLQIHQGKFLKDFFPQGTHFSEDVVFPLENWEKVAQQLPLASVRAFSIDDATTTEIDDAFSVVALPAGQFQIGIHIAVPALAIQPGDTFDQIAQKRMSTVYFPGGKITMLPAAVIEIFSLQAHQARPAISLYVTVNQDGSLDPLIAPKTVLEKVFIARNLRLGEIEHLVTESSIDDVTRDDIDFRPELAVLWCAAKQLHAHRQRVRVEHGQREEKLGPPEPNALPRDFHFEIQMADAQRVDPQTILLPNSDDQAWHAVVSARQRGSVIDAIVAEWMIFSNQTWGSILAEHELPAIYRAQQGWGAQRTRMQTTPCRHEGLGVENYAWCTSPLRRYADLVNQWQLIAYVQQGVMAKLAAPFAPKDTKMMALCAEFENTYAAYNTYQQIVEKYWCLRLLQARGLPCKEFGRVQKEGLVRIESLPLRLPVPEAQTAPRGARVEIEIFALDLLLLTASVRLVQVFDSLATLTATEVEEEIVEPLITLAIESLPLEKNDSSSA